MTDWTTTPPTEEGWYWHHTPDRNGLESQDYKIVHVEFERDKIGVWLFGSWDEFVTLESMGGLWHPEKLQVPPLNSFQEINDAMEGDWK